MTRLKENIEESEVIAEVKKVQRSIRSIEKNEDNSHIFEEHFDLLNDDFIKRLKEKYPDLAYDELKMCALLKLELSTKEIASRLNLSNRGAETKRYRLRKKLGLKKEDRFSNFFEKV